MVELIAIVVAAVFAVAVVYGLYAYTVDYLAGEV